MAAAGGLRVTWLDVFTSTPLAGNALAVVQDADALDDEAMLRFARETRLSETTFVQAPTRDGADYRNRIWMMSGELPFAGHPSLGTAVAVAHARGEHEARYVQETPAGLQPLEVELAGRHARASMLQEPAVFGVELDPAEALAPLGLQAADAHPRPSAAGGVHRRQAGHRPRARRRCTRGPGAGPRAGAGAAGCA